MRTRLSGKGNCKNTLYVIDIKWKICYNSIGKCCGRNHIWNGGVDMRPKEMTKNWIVFWCLAGLLAVIAACVFLLPTSVKHTFRGANVTADGAVLEECNFVLAYTKQNHLFKADCYSDVSLDVAGMHFDDELHTDDIYPYTLSDQPHEWIMLNCYNKKVNAFGDIVIICCSNDQDWCFVKVKLAYEDECQYFVGSVDENVDYEAILEICSALLD